MFDSEWMWIGFVVLIIGLLALDLGVFNRKAHVIKTKEALIMSGFWILVAVIFNIFVYINMGPQKGLEFTTGYVMEKALSVDNLFVFVLVFSYFCVPAYCQHKVLFYGIIGALVFRALFIYAGITLVEEFHFVIYIFGAFLIVTAIRMAFKEEKKIEPDKNLMVRLFRKVMPVTNEYDGDKFFVRKPGKAGKMVLVATPLFVTLIFVESTDIVFAVDSIPAILAITTDPFIVYTSNAFAILGLRALYFALASVITAFCYLKYGLAAILGFVGMKMLLADFLHVPTFISLGVIASLLLITIVASMIVNRGRKTCPVADEVAGEGTGSCPICAMRGPEATEPHMHGDDMCPGLKMLEDTEKKK